jgi:O-methyltransferase involved in polyketide biosynthesis
MPTQSLLPDEPSPTARTTRSLLRLGRTSGQRSAELIAAIRAEFLATPETQALARRSVRIFTRLLRVLPGDKSPFNAVPVRQATMTALVRRALPVSHASVTVIELAAGFGVRGLQLARSLPQGQVIEIDLPDVIEAKQTRLSRIPGSTIPPNLRWIAADIVQTPLTRLISPESADVVIAEGLLMYLTPEAIVRIASEVYASLKPGGVFVADLIYRDGLQSVLAASRWMAPLVIRQVGTFRGLVDDAQDAQQLFRRAGYHPVDVHFLHTLAAELHLELRVPGVMLLVVGHKQSQSTF